MNNIMKKKDFLKTYGDLEIRLNHVSNSEIIYVDDDIHNTKIYMFLRGDTNLIPFTITDEISYPIEYIVKHFRNFHIDIHLHVLNTQETITCEINAKQ